MCHAVLRDTKNMSQKNSTLNLVIHDVNGTYSVAARGVALLTPFCDPALFPVLL